MSRHGRCQDAARSAGDGPVHMSPPAGSGIMPCCGRTPFEVEPLDRLTTDPEQVTCSYGGAT